MPGAAVAWTQTNPSRTQHLDQQNPRTPNTNPNTLDLRLCLWCLTAQHETKDLKPHRRCHELKDLKPHGRYYRHSAACAFRAGARHVIPHKFLQPPTATLKHPPPFNPLHTEPTQRRAVDFSSWVWEMGFWNCEGGVCEIEVSLTAFEGCVSGNEACLPSLPQNRRSRFGRGRIPRLATVPDG